MANNKTEKAAQSREDLDHDFGPWIESPNSTRVSAYRYDYANGEMQVKWRNGKGHKVTVYLLNEGQQIVPESGQQVTHRGSETFRKFALARSKGKYVNTTMNGYTYISLRDSTEKDLPSNPNARVVKHTD